MSKRTSFRFMVDTGTRRSAIWSVSINRNDVYVSSSISKQDKVSLHESGEFQWSMRSEALTHAPYIPETGRHFARWKNPKVPAGDFTLGFFILIAESELRSDQNAPIVKQVGRLIAPEVGFATRVLFAFSPNLKDSNVLRIEPEPLFWHRLPDNRGLLLIQQNVEIDPVTAQRLRAVHATAQDESERHGVDLPHAVVRITDSTGLPGLIEVSPQPPILVLSSPDINYAPPKWIPNKLKRNPI